ncbi:MAG: penicillin-binding protein 2 [Holosporales bacterium]|jgi:penicillin-binding protein 2|nr:penicillin-binding protein 2 [Holosporales bacterium]
MSNKREDKREFTRRAIIFGYIELLLFIVILARLGYIQIYKAEHYKLLSDKNRIVAKQILPSRGAILDSKGRVLARNVLSYSAVLDVAEIPMEERNNVISALISEHGLDNKIIETLSNVPEKINKSNRFILLQENLDWAALSKYYIMSSKIPGVVIEKTQTRQYRYPLEFSHVIGYTGTPTKDDIQNSGNTALMQPMAKIGKTCIEKKYNEVLFGVAGLQHIEVNSRRQFVRLIDNIDAIPGKNIKLTINLDLQRRVYEIVSKHESASCVVINVTTGAILAFVSYPGYDINIFSRKIEQSELKKLYDNPYKPMINKVIAGLYAPGSVFKMVTAMAGLKKGVINRNIRFSCSDCYELGNHKFHCWKSKYGGHGYISLQEAITQSCDMYFYNLANMLTPEDIAEVAEVLGLGRITGIDLPDEKKGLIPTKLWKKAQKKQAWTRGDTVNMSIGQGFVLTTPIQLAKMIAMLVNGMKPITPHLVVGNNLVAKLNYDQTHLQIILDGMYDVVNSSLGTARESALTDCNFEMGGKTGSSQVFRITELQRKLGKTVSEEYLKKEHALFVGYAPTDNPEIAVVVLVEHGGGGAKIAAPLAKEIIESLHLI